MMTEKNFKGSATELCEKLKSSLGFEIQSNVVSKKLMQNAAQLEKLGVQFELKRSHGKRWIEVRCDCSGDGGDGKIPRMTNCCPAGTRPMKNIENMCISPGDGRVTGDGSASKSDGKTDLGDGKTSEKSRREKGGNKPRKKKGTKPKSKKGAQRKARRRANSKR